MKRIILEMGMGADLYGEDYTKAACRAIDDAIRHSSLLLFRSLDLPHEKMQVNVTVGVQSPDEVDCDEVAKKLPRGQAHVRAVHGGQNISHDEFGTVSVIASVAIEALYPFDD